MAEAYLESIVPPHKVRFDLNPEQITVTRRSQTSQRGSSSPRGGTPAGSSGTLFKKSAAPLLALNNVIFFGPDTKDRCDQLLDWMSPAGGLLGALAGAAISALSNGAVNLLSKPPLVTFHWGPIESTGIITNSTIKYERFARDGRPTRANVTIQLQEQPSLLGIIPTNPTSQGLSGRTAHTVASGDSLARIATDRYGNPGRWRQLAECNDIDDPLRIRPGDRVYLPNAGELR